MSSSYNYKPENNSLSEVFKTLKYMSSTTVSSPVWIVFNVIHIFLRTQLDTEELVPLPAAGFLDLSDQGDCFKITKCVAFIIALVPRGASCFGSGFETSIAVRPCVWFPTHTNLAWIKVSKPITPLLTHRPRGRHKQAGLLPTALCSISGSLT